MIMTNYGFFPVKFHFNTTAYHDSAADKVYPSVDRVYFKPDNLQMITGMLKANRVL